MRLVGGVKTWNRLVPHPHVADKNQEGISEARGLSPIPHSLDQSSSARKISSHNFSLKASEIEAVEDRNYRNLTQFLLKGLQTELI